MTEDPHHGISRSVIIVYLMVSYPSLKVFLSIPLSTVPGTKQELVKYLFREWPGRDKHISLGWEVGSGQEKPRRSDI